MTVRRRGKLCGHDPPGPAVHRHDEIRRLEVGDRPAVIVNDRHFDLEEIDARPKDRRLLGLSGQRRGEGEPEDSCNADAHQEILQAAERGGHLDSILRLSRACIWSGGEQSLCRWVPSSSQGEAISRAGEEYG